MMRFVVAVTLGLVGLASASGAAETGDAIDVARDHVVIARAFAALPDGDTPVATSEALRRLRVPLDPLAEPGHPGGVPVEVRAQLVSASIDVALLDLPDTPPEPARVTRTLTRVSVNGPDDAPPSDTGDDRPARESSPQRTVVLAAAEPAPTRRAVRVVGPDEVRPGRPDPSTSAGEVWEVPVREPRVTSRFGPRIDPITGAAGRMHRGTDYGAPTGTPVYATASGRVLLGGWCDRGTGNCIVIEHEGGWRSQYFHLSAVHIGAGDRVDQGEHIGDIGSTGRSTGPHLHFQIGQGSDAVDPERLFGQPVGAAP